MPASNVPQYPFMFDPSQMVNKYSDWNDVKYQMATLPSQDAQGNYYINDALGNRITPPPGVTLTGPNNWGRWDPSTGQTTSGTPNYWGYVQTLANPNKVVTPGIAPAQQNNQPSMGGNLQSIIASLRANQPNSGLNAPGYTPPAGGVPGVTLGGGSSNVGWLPNMGGMGGGGGLNLLNAIAAGQGGGK